MKTTSPACSTCFHDDYEYAVVECVICEKPICQDCQTEPQHELEVCSDDCAAKAIVRLKDELRQARSLTRRPILPELPAGFKFISIPKEAA